jgi:peptidoglycan/xylan/chitin deacetylase (PgdA/CDA1 family)
MRLGVYGWLLGMTLLLSPSVWGAPGIPVLIYHEIVTDGRPPGETVIHLDHFGQQMAWLKSHGYTTLTLAELAAVLVGTHPAPERAVVLTFDDGWKSALLAVPILEAYGFAASFWIIAGEWGIGKPYLEWADIVQLDRHPLFEVASHTFSHPWDPTDNLVTWVDGHTPGKNVVDARWELAASRQVLEQHLGHPVLSLAWPCGWYNDTLITLAQEAGYTMLMTAEDGLNYPGTDLWHVHRTFVDGACDLAAFAAMIGDGRYRVCQPSSPPTRGHLPYERAPK